MLFLIFALGSGTNPVFGQESTPVTPGISAFDLAYFAGASLTTAYDMVGRLPGFSFDGGSSARGFSGTGGNVLIDGARPTAKTDDLASILKRIPVSRVERILLIRGGVQGVDMQGYSVIANILLKQESSTTVIATLQNRVTGDGETAPGGGIEYGHRNGETAYGFTLSRLTQLGDDSPGRGHFTVGLPGAETAGPFKMHGIPRTGWGLTASGSLPLWSGVVGANVAWKKTFFASKDYYGAPLSALYLSSEKREPYELGLNWRGKISAAEISLVALTRGSHDQSLNSQNGTAQVFTSVRDSGENILRLAARYPTFDTLTLEGGIEGALNSFKARSSYTAAGEAVALPAANVRAGERRGEAFLQGTWTLSPEATLDFGTRVEFSRISAAGVPSRSFAFIKPRGLLSWSVFGNSQVRLRAERLVGQLDFSNFVASSNLSGNGVTAGNLNLRPVRRWQYEAAFEQDFWDKGAVIASFLHEDITDLPDYVPIGGGFDAKGNIASASNNEIKLSLTLPLGPAGLDGGLLKASVKWDDSAVRDPFTGQIRQISNLRDYDIGFTYTQDIPAWNSSFEFQMVLPGWTQPAYRIAQISTTRILSPFMQFTWNYKPSLDWDVSVAAENFIPYRLDVKQYNFPGSRATALLGSILDARNNTVPRLFVQARKSF